MAIKHVSLNVVWFCKVWLMFIHSASKRNLPRIVIIGAGFGGITCAQRLRDVPADVMIIDRNNHHLFQPLLYEVATAGLSPADIATPVRSLFTDQDNVSVLMDEVTGIEPDTQKVRTKTQCIDYDFLVIATGAAYSFFDNPHWQRYTLTLKSLNDALDIRERVLTAFERAESTRDRRERRRCMTIAIVGGGPTGVEMAGAAAELCKRTLARDFRSIDPTSARIVLVEAGSRILPAFPQSLSRYAQAALEKLGVEVLTGQPVDDINGQGIVVNGNRIDAATVIWSAGVHVPAVAAWLGARAHHSGKVLVSEQLNVPDRPNVFVIGDAAYVLDRENRPLPGVAPVAKQQGFFVAKAIASRLTGTRCPERFSYRDYGNLATIGRSAAVMDLGWIRLSGWFAWLLWSIAHIFFLIGTRNRLAVFMNWVWAYVTFGRGARLIIQQKNVANQDPSRHRSERKAA